MLSRRINHRNSEQRCHKKSRYQIIIFAFGAILWLTFTITSFVSSLDDFKYADFVSIIDTFVYLISIIIQAIFLIKYDCAILPNHWFFHYVIALMVVDKIWVWLEATFSGLSEIVSHVVVQIHCVRPANFTHSFTKNTESSFQEGLGITLVFLEPFFIEFLTISFGILITLWNSIGRDIEHRNDERNAERNFDIPYDDYAYVVNAEESRQIQGNGEIDTIVSDQCNLLDTLENHRSKWWHSRDKVKMAPFTLFSIFVSVAYFIADLILFQAKIPVPLSDGTKLILYRYIQIAVYLPTLVFPAAIYKMYKANKYRRATFSSSGYLLLFGSIANFIWYIFRFIASVTEMTVKEAAEDEDRPTALILPYLIMSIGCILQVWVQTQFLLAAQDAHQMDRHNSQLTQFCLIFITAINTSEWIQLSAMHHLVVENLSSKHYPVLAACFGEATAKTLIFLLYPLFEIYRFHSAVVAYEILSE